MALTDSRKLLPGATVNVCDILEDWLSASPSGGADAFNRGLSFPGLGEILGLSFPGFGEIFELSLPPPLPALGEILGRTSESR